MENVWVVKTNGRQYKEQFTCAQEATNYAKRSSLGALCAIRSHGTKAYFYENGEVVDKVRAKELKEAVVEILEHENEKYAQQLRGKANRKKA